uniref:Armadillo repeat-containing protein 2 n=1 Tax=Anopheles farauti TaxID=69004 RepID=A0A182QIB9_9DIPT
MENFHQSLDFSRCSDVENRPKGPSRLVRKTSAEIVSEAKSMLAGVSDSELHEKDALGKSIKSVEPTVIQEPVSSIVKNHPLKRRQVQSFDDKITTAIATVPERKILHELYVRVKGSKGSWRGAVLGALYGLVEVSSSRVLLLVASIVLAMNVSGSNLTGACKLVFKIARNENNDTLFMDSDVPELLVDGLGRASPIDDPEACIYGYGAVRFLTGSGSAAINSGETEGNVPHRTLASRLAKQGLCQLMVLHLKMINDIASTTQLSGSPLHALFQLSGALRTLAGSRNIISSQTCQLSIDESDDLDVAQIEQAVPLLVRAAEMCIKEPEVQANIIRTLSVLSERAECCERLAIAASRLGILLGSITQTSQTVEKGLATCNRLGYILGNVMSRWDTARVQFYCCDVSCDALLATLEYYANKSFTLKNQMGDTIVEVLTKLIRIVANMCVNADVGYGMSKRSPLGEVLLNVLLKVKDPTTAELEELLFATLGALHNLSYYYESSETHGAGDFHPGSIGERLRDICGTLCIILNRDHNPARSEVARVLGNMTRNTAIRQTFCEENGMKILKRCLTSKHDELMVTACGVLINVLGDWSSRVPFREIDGPIILRRLLQRGVSNRDWIMAGIACQAIWNYLIDTTDIAKTLGQPEIDFICAALAEGLDEDDLFAGREPDNFWEDFAPVATDLLERLQLCMSNGNSPCESSGEEGF